MPCCASRMDFPQNLLSGVFKHMLLYICDCLCSLRLAVGGTLQGMSEGVWDQVVDHSWVLPSHCTVKTTTAFLALQYKHWARLGKLLTWGPKASWSSDNSCSVVRLIDKSYLWVKIFFLLLQKLYSIITLARIWLRCKIQFLHWDVCTDWSF